MAFILSKILWFLIMPFNIIIVVLLSGWLLLFTRSQGLGKKLIAAGLLLIFFCGLDFMPYFLTHWIENKVQPGSIPDEIDGIIVLVGMVDMKACRPGMVELTEKSDRIIESIILAKKYPKTKLIITGGSGSLDQDQRYREADYLEKLAVSLGITKDRLIIERDSKNTFEHAVAMKKLLPANGKWVLITSAFHMPRALGCFNKAGVKVIPHPVDYKTPVKPLNNYTLFAFLPKLENMINFNISFHELVGLVSFKFMGYTDSIFPSSG